MKVNFTFRWSFLMLLISLMLWPPTMAQNSNITGTVFDGFGEPIIGATILEKGTANGVTSDIDGNFSLKMLDTNHMLVVSFVGMGTKEIKPTPGQNLSITLEDDNQMLDDVVVVGYTSKARKDLTGSVGSVSGAKLEAVPVASAAVALQGKISGVQVTTVDGQPGAEVNIRVRGGTSVTQSNEPLYIVDGFQVSGISDIPPSDIQSIDVLKDASLTAIYGAKGGNGVVVVTTKSAQSGKVQVGINANMSLSHLARKLDLMDAADFVKYQYQWHACDGTRSSNAKFFKANFGNPYDLDMYTKLPSHDWQDVVMGETPLNYSTNITIGGGSDKAKFNLSITNSEDKGIILGSGVRRTNVNLKTNIMITDKLAFQFNPKFSFRRDEGAGGDNVGTGGIIDVLRYRPTNGFREYGFIDPSYADPNEEEMFTYTNPKSDIEINQLIKHSYNYTNGISLNWNPIKGLTLRTEGTIGLVWTDNSRFYGSLTKKGRENNFMPVAEIKNNRKISYSWTNTANYAFTIGEDHNLSFLIGQEIYSSQETKQSNTNRYFPTTFTAREAWNNMNFGTPQEVTSELTSPDRTASFFGQANYNYNHKYLGSITFRADGSTKFAPGNQWGYFPSVSGAWVASEEDFFEPFKSIVSNFKLRAAFGLTGNNRIDSDKYLALYTIKPNGGPGFGEKTQYGEKYYANDGGDTFSNKDIKWETIITRNLAADIALFNGRINITPEFYWNTTKDLLYKSDLPTVTGYGKQMRNIGQVTSKGIEFSISGDIISGKDYVLSANVNFGFNKKIIDKLNGTDNVVWDQNDRWKSSYNDYCLKVGDQVGLIYGFVYDGLYGFDEFDINKTNKFMAVPWGSSAADNGTSRDCEPRSDGYVTVINDISGKSNSGNATLPGKIKFKDLDGDGRITENDRTVIGNTNPKIQGGFGFSGQYKRWDFTTNFTFMLGFDVNNATCYQLSSSIGNKNTFYNVLSKFNKGIQYNDYDGSITGTKGDILYMNYYIDNETAFQDVNKGRTLWNPESVVSQITHSYFVEDGSFLRCNDITIGYTLPTHLVKKCGLSKARFYASVSNPFIITGYSGYDPEVDIQTGLTCGMDYNRYPRCHSYVIGTNITF